MKSSKSYNVLINFIEVSMRLLSSSSYMIGFFTGVASGQAEAIYHNRDDLLAVRVVGPIIVAAGVILFADPMNQNDIAIQLRSRMPLLLAFAAGFVVGYKTMPNNNSTEETPKITYRP